MDTIDPMQNPPQIPLGGLDPADLLKQGVANETFTDGAPSSFHPPSIEELAAIFPRFEILELIGKGGMGAVYKVRQRDLDRIVALKILPPAIGQSPEFSNRFTREAKALAKLNHLGIVTLHEFGNQDGLYFILMEFVDGVNLAQLMKTGRISPREALAIVPQICDALQSAHDQGIVHRDIKPENILLDRSGRVKVADFGIAKVVAAVCEETLRSGDTPVPADQTLAGKIIGTPRYMAPEQTDHPSEVDHRADIYALGVVFYQMLTGELPGKRLEAPSKKVQIDVRLDEIVLRAMEKEPQLRYQTAHEFRTVVDGVQDHPPSLPPSAPRRWWWVFLVMFPVGLVIGLAAGWALASLIPKKYEVDTIIETRPNANGSANDDFLGSQTEVLKSPESLLAVAKDLDLPEKWQISPDSVVSKLSEILQIEIIRGTDLISIRLRHTDKQEAVAIANAVAVKFQQNSPGEVTIHQDATEPMAPVSPHVGSVALACGFVGLIFSPLFAFILIKILQRRFPEAERGMPAAKTRRTGKTVGIVGGVIGVIILVPLLVVAAVYLLRSTAMNDGVKRDTPIAGQQVEKQVKNVPAEGQVETFSDAALAENPELQYLAWQDEVEKNPDWQAWRIDGELVKHGDMRLPPDISTPIKMNLSGTKRATANPRFLNLLISHPAFDQQSVKDIKLMDDSGKPLEVPAHDFATGVLPPSSENHDLGWITASICAGTMDDTPAMVNVRLNYSVGPWRDWKDIAVDFHGSMAVSNGVLVTDPGQGADGKAFIQLTRDRTLDPNHEQFDFIAVTKDGRQLNRVGHGISGVGQVNAERFVFDAPIDQVTIFRCRKRPIKTMTWTVPLPRQLPAAEDVKIESPEVRILAERWLAAIDAGDYVRSWKDAAKFFQQAITEEAWGATLVKFRRPLGKLESRKLREVQKADALPGAPDGKYIIFQFDASFAAKAEAVETVTFMLEEDGSWKPAGYIIR